MVFGSVNAIMFIAWHFETASTTHKREREKHFGTFSVHVRLMVLELASLEEERIKNMTIFDFFKIHFVGFYKAELKSENICTQGGQGFQ